MCRAATGTGFIMYIFGGTEARQIVGHKKAHDYFVCTVYEYA